MPDIVQKWVFEREIIVPFVITPYVRENEKLVSRGMQDIRERIDEDATIQDILNNLDTIVRNYHIYALYVVAEYGDTLSELYSLVNGDEATLLLMTGGIEQSMYQ